MSLKAMHLPPSPEEPVVYVGGPHFSPINMPFAYKERKDMSMHADKTKQ